jgi:hypothetical protein
MDVLRAMLRSPAARIPKSGTRRIIADGSQSDRFDTCALLAWYDGLRGLALIRLPSGSFDMLSLTLFTVFFGLDYVPRVKLAALRVALVFLTAFTKTQHRVHHSSTPRNNILK